MEDVVATGLTAFKKGRSFGGYMIYSVRLGRNLDRRSDEVTSAREGPVRGAHLNGTIPLLGLLIDCWKNGTATMAENECHESEDENSIATPLVLPVREYPN